MRQHVPQNAERGGGKTESAQFTTGPVVVPRTNAPALRDSEFFRLPKPGARCPLSGLSRTTILERGEAGDFKLIRLRKRGSQRGIVLVQTASFLRWLHGQPPVTREERR